jgi:hypothetical protein
MPTSDVREYRIERVRPLRSVACSAPRRLGISSSGPNRTVAPARPYAAGDLPRRRSACGVELVQ